MSCNASDGPSFLAPAMAQQNQQQFANFQNVAASSSSTPLASSSTLPSSEPSQPTPHTYGTRTRQNSVLKPTIRALYSHNAPLPASTSTVPLSAQMPSGSTLTFHVKKEQPKQRRIRPLAACATPSSSSDDAGKHSTGVLKGILKGVKDAGRKPTLQPLAAPPVPAIEFPPSNVVLHPDDASNKVFLAVGRAFLSVVSAASVCLFSAFLFASLRMPTSVFTFVRLNERVVPCLAIHTCSTFRFPPRSPPALLSL